ncbi:DAK2 domain-containing protein [Rhodococcus rhodnii]|uniref:DAK2 domain-containing protein n=2 Tax=Rhodococcus rhodnii TaxID=38312 RepID=A0A6P2CE96_9NOCA|nr:DAK2 domain-containing protein [Rhodococcus rhodnii]EOM75069.1 putative glycerone kinase [Rhodococcus rhodnii LMG 5362]TXG90803.1 DAK2 domain-containing protein [Rhodococcus rhodnii]
MTTESETAADAAAPRDSGKAVAAVSSNRTGISAAPTAETGTAADASGLVLLDWARAAVAALDDRRAAIDEINVFPIPDGDTGTNLLFTMRSALAAAENAARAGRPGVHRIAVALAHGAVAGGRGNSGVILSQILRGLAEATAGSGSSSADAESRVLDTAVLAAAVQAASNLVADAVSRPVEGTIVTVLRVVADHAARLPHSTGLVDAASAIAGVAADALDRTSGQLDVLRERGVVDAGAYGFVVVLDALVAVLGGEPPRREIGRAPAAAPGRHDHEHHAHHDPGPGGPDFEVMYLVGESDADRISALRVTLDALGDSVVVVGDGAGSWSVHVHCADAGGAVEAGLAAGVVSRVRISSFLVDERRGRHGAVDRGREQSHDNPDAHRGSPGRPAGRAVLAIASGDGAAALFEAEGATVLRSDEPVTRAHLLGAVRSLGRPEVIVLPNGALPPQELVTVGAAARDSAHEVLLVATSSMVQGLAALAVHDDERGLLDDAYTMSEAASSTRWGSVRIAGERALTYVGPCEPGEAIGLMGHEVVVIDEDGAAAAIRLVDLAVRTGGELVTLVVGGGAPPGFGDRLREHIEHRHPGVEVMVYNGGQHAELLQLGVE